MLRTRLITAAILLPTVLAIVLLAPPHAFTGFILLTTIWGLVETATMLDANILRASAIAVIGLVSACAVWSDPAALLWLPAAAIASACALVWIVGRRGAEASRTLPGWRSLYPFWVGALFPYFAKLRNQPHGIVLILLMVLLVVASDSGAYFVGRALGRVKLLPRVSPHKTVEGALGGIAASIAVALLLRHPLTPWMPAMISAILGAAISLLAQVGDLANSAWKRLAGVKDSGWIFPGHGGLLDRTCSLVFPAVFSYYFLSR
ncbi:MAG TPA: phosphatidate cytidylyltransferase [Candidatus Binataceae bacterium]|nr:phosphatidate cytidylyltransferase [Candidatus Binataceae bacterium]